MRTAHERIADGVKFLAGNLDPTRPRMPVGLDGAILEHLMTTYWSKYRALHNDCLDNTVEVSSHYDRSDSEKFDGVLSSLEEDIVYAIDLRTKTGSLGRTLKDMKLSWEKKTGMGLSFYYTVLFDTSNFSDLHVYSEELSDNDRINWFPSYEHVKNMFHKEDGSWRRPYNISHKSLSEIPDVRKLEKLMLT